MGESAVDTELRAFAPFPSIARLSRQIVVTEKIDGTNGQIVVLESGPVLCGSRNQWLERDNGNGFFEWVLTHADELRAGLGVGRHFGEWWGPRVTARRYPVPEARFSLFNVERWRAGRPECCGLVPVLYEGIFDTAAIDACLESLRREGSRAAPGFMNPEGVVVFHAASKALFKKTLHGDEHKGARDRSPV